MDTIPGIGTVLALTRCVVITLLRMLPAREQRRHLLGILRSVQGPTQAQPHCLKCRVYEEDGYEEAVLYMEAWDSEEDFKRHVRSDIYRRVLAAVELSRTSPEIAFHQVSTTKGMELVEELRREPEQANNNPA